ncbi:RNA exonuclease 3 [Linnemannia hyalina]|uniref:RNA exonuclease 3 n=1 Tax=Linnemannia hyalina TaxID=64524 RepID=A0A9P7XKH6_9FUNG|nr:RNA exonuclease 3 [Linnemannia hyalina]
MFASSGLFSGIPCPFMPACPRESFCVYSHTLKDTPPPESVPTPTPMKRKLNTSEGSRSGQASTSQQRASKPTTTVTGKTSPGSSSTTKSSAEEAAELAAKKRKLAAEISSGPPSGSRSATASTSTPSKATTTPAVLMARPDTSSSSSSRKPTTNAAGTSRPSNSTGKLTVSGPPVLKIDIRAHSKPLFRQAVATQFYNEFLRIYTPLSSEGACLATAHAVDQEKDVHSKTNQGSYRSLAASILQRLKKRPASTGIDDVGIDGDWVDPSLKANEDAVLEKIWKAAGRYVQTVKELEDNGYPVAIPRGTPPRYGPKKECERCTKMFEVSEDLEGVDMHACQYHQMRLRNKLHNGDKIKYFPCCDAPQGSTGCQDGPHVFKDDEFLDLHHRIPFIETPKDCLGGKKPHSVVAMDCEMCYTTGGFELIRISVVDKLGKVIMDELIKPSHPVLDLNSRFSGITSLEEAKLDLEQARDKFLELVNRDTIVVGQSLENDFKVLRLIHTRVVDTAMAYLNYRYSLQKLAKMHLSINIQESETGHDSFEDAKTCLDLVRIKMEQDMAS